MNGIRQYYRSILLLLLLLTGVVLLGNKIGKPPSDTKTAETFSPSIDTLPDAKKTETVSLKNGASFDLTASMVKKTIGGQTVKMLAYNGSIPGPLIQVPQGGEITVNFTNNTDIDTTIHSHGVRVNNAFDGVPDMTQDPVKPGKKFTYTLTFPDAGVYWYHPHIREDYAQELGLYGNFLVTPTESSYWNPVNRELPLFIDDILLDVGGGIPQFSRAVATHALMGRFGNTMLVNGETDFTQEIESGEVVRFYLTNAANTRIFNLSIPGVKMKRVGADNGKYEKESEIDSIRIAPSEREIVEAFFETPGTYTLQHTTPTDSYVMATFTVTGKQAEPSYRTEFIQLRTNHHVSADIEKYQQFFNKAPDKTLTIGIQTTGMGGMQNGSNQHMMHDGSMMMNDAMTMGQREKIEWEDTMGMMNAVSTSETVKWKLIDVETKKENMDMNWQFKKGETVKISIINDPNTMHPMQHPIHIHGQRFLVLRTNGIREENLVWKDTALIQTGDTVELLVQMDNPGEWAIHCHVPEHMESGMMSSFSVL